MAQTIKVYTDEGIDTAIIKGLRLHGLDVLSAPEAGMLGKTDEEQLELAKREGRVIFVRLVSGKRTLKTRASERVIAAPS